MSSRTLQEILYDIHDRNHTHELDLESAKTLADEMVSVFSNVQRDSNPPAVDRRILGVVSDFFKRADEQKYNRNLLQHLVSCYYAETLPTSRYKFRAEIFEEFNRRAINLLDFWENK